MSAGLLFGNYRTKRNISMTDSSEKDESLELGITISHYVCSNSRRPTPPKHHTNRQRNDVCLGMFVIRPDTQLYPTFKDMETLNAIIPTQEHQPDTNNTHSRGHTYSTTAATAPPPPPPLLLLMLSVPRMNRHHQRRSDAAGWMYNLKHVCFTYCRGSSPPFATALLKVPSLAPDLQGEFAAVTCLDASCGARRGFSDSAGAMDLDAVGHGGLSGALSRQFAVMAASGMVQVVDTELLAAGVIDSIKVSRCSQAVQLREQ